MKRRSHSVFLSCQIALFSILSIIPSQAQNSAGAEIRDLIRQLDRKSEALSASVKLQKMGEEAIRLLDSCLISNDRDVRIYGALALTRFHPKPAMIALRREATSTEFVDIALESLVKLGDGPAIGILIEKLASDKQRDYEYSRTEGCMLLLKYTQENIRLDPKMALWRNWWKQHHGNFESRLMQAEIDDWFNFNDTVSF
jgi:hypothetical protein